MAMSSHLAKRAICSCFFSSPRYHHRALLAPLLCSPLSTLAQPQKDLPFLAQYLISSFDISDDRALKYSADPHLTAIKCPARPEAVVKFLSETGLSDTQIKAVVSFYPLLLAFNVEKALKPKVQELMDAGFSQEILVNLIRNNPTILVLKNTLPRLLFWRDFVGNDDQALLKIIRRNGLLITHNVDQFVLPRINLLKEYGLSNPNIVLLLQRGNRCTTQNLDTLREKLELIEEIGIPRGSGMFLHGLKAIGGLTKDTIRRKVEFFKKTYGWSQEDVNSAFRKCPQIFACSEYKAKSNMDFLIRKAGFEAKSIASYPYLILPSLERVVIPRHNVLSALKANKLKLKCSLFSACKMSERHFLENYVVSFEKDIPGLSQAYVAANNVKGQA